MENYKTNIIVNGQKLETLKDILPSQDRHLDVLFIAKTPALKSVEAGHYFQGKNGRAFWNKLKDFKILNFDDKKFEDESLLENNCGLTDIVKVPRNYGNEPLPEEYKQGVGRILAIINTHKPKIIIFVYKGVLDNLLNFGFGISRKSQYGFNPIFENIFTSKIFVFPMPGTPCNSEQANLAMNELKMFMTKSS